MCEYIARGAARKILSDTGDIEQFQFYEPPGGLLRDLSAPGLMDVKFKQGLRDRVRRAIKVIAGTA